MTVVRQGDVTGLSDLLAGGQIRGARPYQEDDFRISMFPDRDPDGCDFVMALADGMGGHRGGAEASRIAVTAFVKAIGSPASGGVRARLQQSLDKANDAVAVNAAADRRLWNMGCTLVGCVVTELDEAHWISVGDSPLWRLRAGRGPDSALSRLNADHSMKPVYAELVRRGEMTDDDARRGGHQLRSVVMGGEVPMVDPGTARLSEDDLLILASDGLETLSVERIGEICGMDDAVAALVREVLKGVEDRAMPLQDNATVLMYRHKLRRAVHRRLERLTAPTRPPSRSLGATSDRASASGKEEST